MPDYTLVRSQSKKVVRFSSQIDNLYHLTYKCFLMSYCVDTRDDSITLETEQVTPLCISHGGSTTITANQ